MLQRRQEDVLPELPALRWGHIPVSPGSVPPQPEIGIDIAAVLEKLEHGALSVDERVHLETLRRWAGIAKVPAVVELVQGELEATAKIVVFAVHRDVIAGLAAGLGPVAAVIDGSTSQAVRQQLIDAFQQDDLPRVLILQLQTAGTAITLHRSNRVLFAETSWTPADVVQAAKRCHRIGQTKSVLASTISLAGSIDEQIAAIFTRKARELAELESLLRKESLHP
jgi:Helicase conserved C-terminal domain